MVYERYINLINRFVLKMTYIARLIPPLFVVIPVLRHESRRSCICELAF